MVPARHDAPDGCDVRDPDRSIRLSSMPIVAALSRPLAVPTLGRGDRAFRWSRTVLGPVVVLPTARPPGGSPWRRARRWSRPRWPSARAPRPHPRRAHDAAFPYAPAHLFGPAVAWRRCLVRILSAVGLSGTASTPAARRRRVRSTTELPALSRERNRQIPACPVADPLRHRASVRCS